MYEFATETVRQETLKCLDYTNRMITGSINFQLNAKIPFLPFATRENLPVRKEKEEKHEEE